MKTEFSLAQLADPDIAEADKILRACVHCGFCTATCPTYVLLGDELDSPSNADHPSHRVAGEVALEQPFLDAFGGTPPPDPVLGVARLEEYAQLIDALGFAEQNVRLQVYPHHLGSTADVVEWVKGTSLTRFRDALSPEMFDAFVVRYRTRLLEVLGDHSPYLYTFKRILFWARDSAA